MHIALGSAMAEEERQRAEELRYAADHQKQRADEQANTQTNKQTNTRTRTNEHAQHDPNGGSARGRADDRTYARAVLVAPRRPASAIDRATSPCGAASPLRRGTAGAPGRVARKGARRGQGRARAAAPRACLAAHRSRRGAPGGRRCDAGQRGARAAACADTRSRRACEGRARRGNASSGTRDGMLRAAPPCMAAAAGGPQCGVCGYGYCR